MNMNTVKMPFSAVAGGATIHDVECNGADLIGFAVDISSIGGAPTNFTVHAYPMTKGADSDVPVDNGNSFNTGAKTAAGEYPLDLWGSTVVGPFFRNSAQKWRLTVTFTAGTSPNITGDLYAFISHPRY